MDSDDFHGCGREISNVSVKLTNIDQMQCYQAVFGEVLSKLQASEEFKDAQFKTWDDPVE